MEVVNDNLDTRTVPNADAAVQSAGEFDAITPMTGVALRAYGDHTRRQREDEMIIQYLPLVHRIVQQVAAYLHPPLSRDDLISAGSIGLVKAARDFDPTRDAEFKTYAYIRIRGAVIDELRGWSFAPPTVKKMFDRAQEIAERFLQERGTAPSDEQIAEAMDLPLDKLYQVYETARARHFLSISGADEDAPALGDMLAAPQDSAPDSRLRRHEIKQTLAEAILELPEKQQQIILLYYHRELTMKQISEVMELTESRISQLHAAALFKLSVRMRHWRQDDSADREQEPEEAIRSF